MNRFFQSRFWSAMNFLGTAFILNVFWLLGCLPVVTAGASTAALCQCYFRLFTNREESLPRLFLKGFRSCFKQATLAWLVQLFFAADVALILWTRKQAIALPWLLTNKLSLALGIVISLLKRWMCVWEKEYSPAHGGTRRFGASYSTWTASCLIRNGTASGGSWNWGIRWAMRSPGS